MRGETVRVVGRKKTGTDAHGNAVYESERADVADVLVSPGATGALPGANRPDGAEVAFTLYFPKSYEGDLYGKGVEVRGKPFKVIGRPQRYSDESAPGKWNMVAEVEAVYG